MRKMDAHPLTVSLLDLYQRDAKDEIYLVMELMTTDLHQVIQSDQVCLCVQSMCVLVCV